MRPLRRAALVAVTLIAPTFTPRILAAQNDLRVNAPNTQTPISAIPERRGALCNPCLIKGFDGGFARLSFEDVSPLAGDLRIRATLTIDPDYDVVVPNGRGGETITPVGELGQSFNVLHRRVTAIIVLTATNPATGETSRHEMQVSGSSERAQTSVGRSGTYWPEVHRRLEEVKNVTQVYNQFRFQVSEIRWKDVDLGGVRYLDNEVRRRLAAATRAEQQRQAADSAARAQAARREGAAVGSASSGTAAAGTATAGTAGAATGSRTSPGGNPSTSGSATDASTTTPGARPAAAAPRRLPPQPIPYDREAVAAQERRVLAERQRQHDELAERYRAVRQEQARRQQMANRAVEAAVAPLVAMLEARERERKAAAIRAAARELNDALADTERRVQESIVILEEDERALTDILASHPSLPDAVRTAIEADLTRIDELREEKLELVEAHAQEVEDAFIEGNEEPYNGDLTRVNRRNAVNFLADGRSGLADGVITLSAEAVRAVMAARIPEGRQFMILQQLSVAVANSAARTCAAERILEAATPYLEFGADDSRMRSLTEDARKVSAYTQLLSEMGNANSRLARRLESEYGTVRILVGLASTTGRAGDRRIGTVTQQDVRFVAISGEADTEAMLLQEIGGTLPSRPNLDELRCDLPDARVRFANLVRNQERFVRAGAQTAYLSRPFSVPERLAVPVTIVAGQPLSLRPADFRDRFQLHPHLANLGKFQHATRFSVNERLLRNLRVAARPGGYFELRTEFGQRLVNTSRYMRGETTPYFGITYASAGAMFRQQTDILRAFGSESKTVRSFRYLSFGGIEPNVGLMRRVLDVYHARVDVNVPLLQVHTLEFARTRTVDGVEDVDENPSLTAATTLAPTLSVELHRVSRHVRFGLRYGFTFFPVVDLTYTDEDKFTADDRAFADGFFENQLRHALTFTVNF